MGLIHGHVSEYHRDDHVSSSLFVWNFANVNNLLQTARTQNLLKELISDCVNEYKSEKCMTDYK